MSNKILIQASETGLSIPSEYNRAKVKQLVKEGVTLFELTPRIRASKKQTGYLEGAVIFAWAKYQYGLDPKNPETHEKARNLFKQDFWFEVIKDRNGNPKKTLKSLSGSHGEALNVYTELATENGYPIPNEKLYLKWRDEYSMETRWSNYYDWLDFLGLEEDSMPSDETFNKLKN
jgi:hypothetical protein